MNPETNKFEPLTAQEQNEGLAKKIQAELGDAVKVQRMSLLRPDGSPVPKHWTVFTIDELVAIKDYTFRVAHIGESHILLEPVKPTDKLNIIP